MSVEQSDEVKVGLGSNLTLCPMPYAKPYSTF
jgi:hypothetical protein